MAGITEGIGGSLSNVAGQFKTVGLILFGALFIAGMGYGGWWWAKKRKTWNLKVEIKIPRSDGRLVNSEWAKGEYNTQRGVVLVKRKGKKPIAMKPFDPTKYLQGSGNILTVMQLSPGHYIPILVDSFLVGFDDETKEECAMMKLSADYSQSKAWKSSFERDAKGAYTIGSLLKDYLPYIGFGILLISIFIGFSILYGKIK